MTLHKALLGAALVQALLALLLWRADDATPPGSRDVLTLDTEDITEITVSTAGERGEPGDSVTLRSQDDGWVVASAGDYPAKQDEIDDLLEKLSDLTVAGEPIAAQAISHAALAVGDTDFGRRIELAADDDSLTVYLGRSNTGALNIRTAGAPEVFAGRGANLYDFAATPASYVERSIVDVPKDSLDQIMIENPAGALVLRQEAGQWAPTAVPQGREVDSTELDRVINAATSVRLAEPVAEGRFTNPIRVSWSGTDDDGEPLVGSFEIGDEDGTNRFVRLEGHGHDVTVSGSALRVLIEADIDSLTTEPEVPNAPEE